MASGAGGGGPRRAVAAPSPFGEDDGNKDDGGSHLPERGERGAAGWAARAVEATGPAHWLAWLPPALRFPFFF